MLKRKRQGLEMGENAYEGFFLRQAVFNDAVADQEGLHSGRADVVHANRLSRQPSTAVPPRASNTSPNSVWVEPTRQK